MITNNIPSGNPSNPYWPLIGMAVGMVVSVLVFQYVNAPPPIDEILMNTASEINKNCPIRIDNATQLDNTIALPGNVFQYNYTLVDFELSEINVDEMEAQLETFALSNIRTHPEMEQFRKNKVTVNYSYRDSKGEYITKITITPDEYK